MDLRVDQLREGNRIVRRRDRIDNEGGKDIRSESSVSSDRSASDSSESSCGKIMWENKHEGPETCILWGSRWRELTEL